MRNVNIQQSICQAIEMIVNRRLSDAQFNTTRRGIINKVLDETRGEYEIRHQDRRIKAYSPSSVRYAENTQVYFLNVNNESQDYFILGGVEHTVDEYNAVSSSYGMYNKVGINLISGSIELSSYKDDQIVLYDYLDTENLITVDQKSAERYIKEAQSIVFGADFRTSFSSQQIGGNYGLKFYLTFADENDASENAETTKCFIVDTRNVIGNPYLLTKPTYVESVQSNFDTEKFLRIDKITAFVNGFPENKDKVDIKDILIFNLILNGVNVLTQQELDGYTVYIDYSDTGNVLESNKTETVSVTAQLKIKGKIVTDNVDYYWFKENVTVFRGSPVYSGYGGNGWERLNPIPTGSTNSTPARGGDTVQFTCNEEKADNWVFYTGQKLTRIKCVAVYNSATWVSGEGQIINETPYVDVTIESSDKLDSGENKVKYYLDAGSPTLTCNISDDYEVQEKLKFSWFVTPYKANGYAVEAISDEEKQARDEVTANYDDAMQQIDAAAVADRQKVVQHFADVIQAYRQLDPTYIYTDVDKNQSSYYNFLIKNIVTSTKISCTVYDGNKYLGTANIELENSHDIEGNYTLTIEGGTQVFQYDSKGNSPASASLEKPLQIKPLTFTLYNKDGDEISHDQIKQNGFIKWYIPKASTNNTLLVDVYGTDEGTAANQFNTYTNLDSFSYSIADQYDRKKTLNYIKLQIKLQELLLAGYTNFTFAKQGDPGTNGTDYVAKLTPTSPTDNVYCIFDPDKGGTGLFIDDNDEEVEKIKFQLYNNSRKVEDLDYQKLTFYPGVNGQDAIIKPGPKQTDLSCPILISGEIPDENGIDTRYPVNIIRGTYTKDLEYYAQYPIVFEYVKDSFYRFKITPKTGYKYVVYKQDGTSPSYDNTLPFEVFTEELREFPNGEGKQPDKFWIRKDNCFYSWQTRGNLKEPVVDSTFSNIATIEPKDTFDGLDLTSAILIKIKDNNEQSLGYMYIPIYMMINRYNHAALNGWDGNSISLSNNGKGQTILAPQIGAGIKDRQNRFTGIFMGDIHRDNPDPDQAERQIGLMGYHQGQRSIFLNAQNGMATFGKQGSGQIIIDPTTTSARIYGGNYSTAAKTGMLIDLSQPSINFGSGNFSVDKDGNIKSTSGTIGGWKIGSDSLASTDGKLKLSPLQGINFNNKFTVDENGAMTATTGTIGGWKIYEEKMSAGNGTFQVNKNGELTAKSGTIGNWHIGDNLLWAGSSANTKQGIRLSPSGSLNGGNGNSTAHWSINSNGSASFNTVSINHVTADDIKATNANVTGVINANSGRIGNITIADGGISGTGFKITPNYAYFTGLVYDTNAGGSGKAGYTSEGATAGVIQNGNTYFKPSSIESPTVKTNQCQASTASSDNGRFTSITGRLGGSNVWATGMCQWRQLTINDQTYFFLTSSNVEQ